MTFVPAEILRITILCNNFLMLRRVLIIAGLLGIPFVSSSNAETPVEHGRYWSKR